MFEKQRFFYFTIQKKANKNVRSLEEVEANKGLLFDLSKGAHTNKQKNKWNMNYE